MSRSIPTHCRFQLLRRYGGGSAPAERVKHNIALRSLDAEIIRSNKAVRFLRRDNPPAHFACVARAEPVDVRPNSQNSNPHRFIKLQPPFRTVSPEAMSPIPSSFSVRHGCIAGTLPNIVSVLKVQLLHLRRSRTACGRAF